MVYCVLSLAFLYWALRVVFYADAGLLKAIAFLVGGGLLFTFLAALVATMVYVEYLLR